MFPGAIVPHDFDTIDVPFAEKGDPELIRWDAERRPAAGRGDRLMRLSAPTWPTVILGVACGVLFGALLAIVVNGDDAPAASQPRTITVAKTVTAPPVTTPGTVIVRTLVPDLVGVQLDVAKQRLAARQVRGRRPGRRRLQGDVLHAPRREADAEGRDLPRAGLRGPHHRGVATAGSSPCSA